LLNSLPRESGFLGQTLLVADITLIAEVVDAVEELAEEARLTWQRIQQGSDCILVNILKGNGCVAPESRLPCFEAIYNKKDYQAEL
jgi:hypothetical protein